MHRVLERFTLFSMTKCVGRATCKLCLYSIIGHCQFVWWRDEKLIASFKKNNNFSSRKFFDTLAVPFLIYYLLYIIYLLYLFKFIAFPPHRIAVDLQTSVTSQNFQLTSPRTQWPKVSRQCGDEVLRVATNQNKRNRKTSMMTSYHNDLIPMSHDSTDLLIKFRLPSDHEARHQTSIVIV